MEVEKRRKAVQGLVDVSVVETPEPITVIYDMPQSFWGSFKCERHMKDMVGQGEFQILHPEDRQI
ncbi:hypothetical protein C1H46_032325 [Malus baccata]|uniref:Uncharacterized protein n=1 Tax=Malus baccata TaxID=106549 RepID=A0A540L6R3_MALBA|nr:hypothetical protein C1H46_032325 [Malus baccata]